MNKLIQRNDDEGVAYLTLTRPEAYNSLSLELMSELTEVLQSISSDISVRVVVLKGAGRGFCSGHDLKEMLSAADEAFYRLTFETCSLLMQTIVSLPIPVIAQVHGVATAAGCQLVASCDLAYAADTSRFATPGVNIGLFCSTPMVALTRAIHPKHSLEMLLTGELISAERAAQIGLVNEVVTAADLDAFVTSKANKIASKSRKTLQIGKEAFHQQRELSLADAYQLCSSVMTSNMLIDDAQEGIDAFVNKRKPEWKHQ